MTSGLATEHPPNNALGYTQRDFQRIAGILAADSGICLGAAKAPHVYSRLVKRLRALGLENFSDYCALLENDAGEERQRMIAALTTHVTSFFREPHHFTHLREMVLPGLIQQARRGRKIRLWSAGCSTGEEAYSLAITVLEYVGVAAAMDIKILATDVDEHVLERGRKGVYPLAALAPIGEGQRKRWFKRLDADKDGPQAAICEPVRNLVRFNRLNLMAPWPMKGRFDAVMCRNVAIYFEAETRRRLWRRMGDVIAENGFLYVGHSERIAEARDLFAPVGVTSYQRQGG